MAWIYWTLLVLCLASTLTIIVVVLSENRNPVKSLAWVTVLLLLPVLGQVLYLFFGRSIKNQRMITRRNRRRLKRVNQARAVDPRRLKLSDSSRQQIQLARTMTGALFHTASDFQIFTDGTEKFQALLEDLAKAQRYIHLQYYIFEDDQTGRSVRKLLMAKARAGVTVRVIYDHVGSWSVNTRFFKEMRQAGVQAYPFFRVTFPWLGTKVNWRNHRKIAVIDGQVAYVGGMNIADRYVNGGRAFKMWRDCHVRLTGPAVSALQYSFAVDWNFMGQPLIEESAPPVKPQDKTLPSPQSIGLQVMTGGPTSQWSNIAFVFFKAITNARRRVWLQTPYFLPTEGLLKALQTAALAGIDVRVMIPQRCDSVMLRNASFSYISESLRAGIKFYLFQPGMLHSKTLLVDDEFVSIGSTNFDFRSFEHNFEVNLMIYSQQVNARMAAIFADDQAHSQRVTTDRWRRRPRRQKAAESLTRLLSPIL